MVINALWKKVTTMQRFIKKHEEYHSDQTTVWVDRVTGVQYVAVGHSTLTPLLDDSGAVSRSTDDIDPDMADFYQYGTVSRGPMSHYEAFNSLLHEVDTRIASVVDDWVDRTVGINEKNDGYDALVRFITDKTNELDLTIASRQHLTRYVLDQLEQYSQ